MNRQFLFFQAVERKAMQDGIGLSERDVKVIIQQLVKALEFMHEKKLVHRDMRYELCGLMQNLAKLI